MLRRTGIASREAILEWTLRRHEVTRFCRKLRMLVPAWIVMIAYTFAAATALIEPHSLTIDRSLPRTI